MNARKVQITQWVCEKCAGRYWGETLAEECCAQRPCCGCGIVMDGHFPNGNGQSQCYSCREKSRLERAKKMTLYEFYSGDRMVAIGDGFYADAHEAVQHFVDYADEGDEPERYAWACDPEAWAPNLNLWIEQSLEQHLELVGGRHPDGHFDSLIDLKEITAKFQIWMEEQPQFKVYLAGSTAVDLAITWAFWIDELREINAVIPEWLSAAVEADNGET